MHARHVLETALTDEIKLRHNKRAFALIELFQQPPPIDDTVSPKLSHIDADGKSFLYLALEAKNKAIAAHLLTLQRTQKSILFAKTKNQVTLFHVAALAGFTDLFDELVDAAKIHATADSSLKYWLHLNDDLNPPLAYAAAANHLAIVKTLIGLIQEEDNAALIIQQLNKYSRSVLHHTMRHKIRPIGPALQLLMPHHSDLSTPDINGVSAIQLFSQKHMDTQTAIFCCLEKLHQQTLLKHYYAHVLTHLDDEALKSAYLTLTPLHSLRAYMIARLELNATMPPEKKLAMKEHYAWLDEGLEKNESGQIEKTSAIFRKKSILKSALAPELPRYSMALFDAKAASKAAKSNQKTLFIIDSSDSDSDSEYTANLTAAHEKLIRTQLLHQDLDAFDQLIQQIQSLIPTLEARTTSTTHRALAISLPILLAMLSIGLEIYLIYETVTSVHYVKTRLNTHPYLDCNQPEMWPRNDDSEFPDPAWSYECTNEYGKNQLIYGASAFVVGLLGIAATWMLGCHASPRLWKTEPTISPHDNQSLLDELEKKILSPLLDLKEPNTGAKASAIKTLADDVAALKSNQRKTNALVIMKRLLQTLKDLRADVYASNQPISATPAEISIDMEYLSSEAEESRPLLSLHKSQ